MIPTQSRKHLPVSVKLLVPLLTIFLSLWGAGTLIFGITAKNNLEQTAKTETHDLAVLLQQDLQQKRQQLQMKARWVSRDPHVLDALLAEDFDLLLRDLLPIQSTLGLDFITITDPQGKTLISLKQGLLNQLPTESSEVVGSQTGLELSNIMPAEGQVPPRLASHIAMKSEIEVLATLSIGITVNDTLLQQIRGDTSVHLAVFEADRMIASTLAMPLSLTGPMPAAQDPSTRVKIAGEPYLAKAIELTGFDETTLKVLVFKSIKDTVQAEHQLWWTVGGFGLLGALLFVGVTLVGWMLTQSLSRRIQRLTQATQQLADGDLTLRIPVISQDEVGQLAIGFNTMAEQLTHRDRQITQQMQQLQIALAELHRTQTQMVQTEKMSALGQMVAGIAHEINNPVSFIHGNLDYVQQYTQNLLNLLASYQTHYPNPPTLLQAEIEQVEIDFLTEDLQKILQSMKMGSDRIRDIVLSLRNFSRLDEADLKLVDLHEGIDSTLMLVQHQLEATSERPKIEVIKNYGNLPQIECYPGHLNQVFLHLIVNAIDALSGSATSKNFQPSNLQIEITTRLTVDYQVQVTIADNGIGMSEELRDQIFNPFFTTKQIGQGTGLGLSISYQIITDRHAGKIECDSIPGQGCKFVIEIPLRQPERSEAA